MKFLDKFLWKNETLKCGIYSTPSRRGFAKGWVPQPIALIAIERRMAII
jgi:hypothetical protein